MSGRARRARRPPVADVQPGPQRHVSRVRCVGGPLNGVTVALHSWGTTAEVPELMPCADGHGGHGTYSLQHGIYTWQPGATP